MPSRACIASKENEKRKMGSERFNALPGMYCFTDVTDDVTDNTQFQCPPGHVLLHGDWTRKFTPIVVSMPSRACIASGERPEHYPADNGFNALPGMYCFRRSSCHMTFWPRVSMPSRACIASGYEIETGSQCNVSMPSRACIASQPGDTLRPSYDWFQCPPGHVLLQRRRGEGGSGT